MVVMADVCGPDVRSLAEAKSHDPAVLGAGLFQEPGLVGIDDEGPARRQPIGDGQLLCAQGLQVPKPSMWAGYTPVKTATLGRAKRVRYPISPRWLVPSSATTTWQSGSAPSRVSGTPRSC